jgi:hypothetical protein
MSRICNSNYFLVLHAQRCIMSSPDVGSGLGSGLQVPVPETPPLETTEVTADVWRSPRIAARVKNPRLLMHQWLEAEPPETVSRLTSRLRSSASPGPSRPVDRGGDEPMPTVGGASSPHAVADTAKEVAFC